MANELRRRNVGEQKNNSDEEAASDYAISTIYLVLFREHF